MERESQSENGDVAETEEQYVKPKLCFLGRLTDKTGGGPGAGSDGMNPGEAFS